jgi:hypothetical protein
MDRRGGRRLRQVRRHVVGPSLAAAIDGRRRLRKPFLGAPAEADVRPLAGRASAMPNPRPRLEAVTSARLPVSSRSMGKVLSVLVPS